MYIRWGEGRGLAAVALLPRSCVQRRGEVGGNIAGGGVCILAPLASSSPLHTFAAFTGIISHGRKENERTLAPTAKNEMRNPRRVKPGN